MTYHVTLGQTSKWSGSRVTLIWPPPSLPDHEVKKTSNPQQHHSTDHADKKVAWWACSCMCVGGGGSGEGLTFIQEDTGMLPQPLKLVWFSINTNISHRKWYCNVTSKFYHGTCTASNLLTFICLCSSSRNLRSYTDPQCSIGRGFGLWTLNFSLWTLDSDLPVPAPLPIYHDPIVMQASVYHVR